VQHGRALAKGQSHLSHGRSSKLAGSCGNASQVWQIVLAQDWMSEDRANSNDCRLCGAKARGMRVRDRVVDVHVMLVRM
jgi:hypothetical protein